MQTTSIVPASFRVQSPPLSGIPALPKRLRNGREKGALASIIAMRNDDKREKRRDYKLVDQNMVVLKMRIQEMEMKERENAARRDKEWYEDYDSDVYELVGLLQMLMMNNRPSLVLGVVALLVISSSASLIVVFSYLLGNFM